jgi:hypothetical protein
MKLGDRALSKGMTGADVIELQMRLAGFSGTIWDGSFGPGTESQVITFQKDYMGASPTGVMNPNVLNALIKFAYDFPIDFNKLKCLCGTCDGFGHGQFKGMYMPGQPQIEAYNKYEYPGIHKAILHAFRAAWFYARKAGFGEANISCGYRCSVNNAQHSRTSTNHMGKALDWIPTSNKPNDARALMVVKSNFQIGWSIKNMKALEPADIAPTWVHMDVREMGPFNDLHFVKNKEDLDSLIIKEKVL